MKTTYEPQTIEQKWSQKWEQAGYFKPSGKGKPYCIVIPPPNVTGNLHMGHGFQHTLMDILIRYHRMQGYNTLWQVGTDHAGIATQMVVAQQLINQGKDPYKLTREEFVKEIFTWKETAKNNINQQMRRIGISADWSKERFTMDEGLSHAVQKVFIDLYDEELIYRGKKLVNWDPVLNTAISDLEVVFEEQDSFLWYIRYPIENSEEFLTVATTRPETMLGDTAVAVHPEDERYQELIGSYVLLPLTERKIPIIADPKVDSEFGTGCVKITPAHDFTDYEIGQHHDLPMINIFTQEASLNDNVPVVYRGMDRFDARKQIIQDLKEAGYLQKIEKYKTKIPLGDRTDAVIEPYLTDQWFVKTEPLAKAAIEVVTSGEIKFIPHNWHKLYLQWLNNIEDWCISRQLVWGHRIPAWYDEKGNIFVAHNEQEARKKYKIPAATKLIQDQNVLDTWFSSALWPFSSLGWPEKTQDFSTFYPTNTLITGFDIIFFWVARMVMMAKKFTKKIPFKEIYITGLIRDKNGQKMSKSKGNVLDPIDLVDGITLEKLIKKRTKNLMLPTLEHKITRATRKEFPKGIEPYGMDALRFTFCALAIPTQNINFDINRLAGYRNFCNKIFNAARFVLMHAHTHKFSNKLTISDKWIWSRLQTTIKNITETIHDYRFDLVAKEIYEFVWHEYCDWYLELYKIEQGSSKTIIEVLENILRLIHPIMPFISEEIWQLVAPILTKKGKTIMLESYPKFDKNKLDEKATQELDWIKKIIINIRNLRGEMNIAPNKLIPVIFHQGSASDKKLTKKHLKLLQQLGKLDSITWLTKKLPPVITALADNLEIHIPVSELIDLAAEQERLQKEITKTEKEIKLSKKKLNNLDYINKAPKDIVNKERSKLQENQTKLHKWQEQLKKVIAMHKK